MTRLVLLPAYLPPKPGAKLNLLLKGDTLLRADLRADSLALNESGLWLKLFDLELLSRMLFLI
jgi:hypothetical protein